ncbi:DNA segregation ATPase FtsK/SpoIIIE, S-DNA-T family [Pseudonocardia ammonioxydans]|uniref:DNA segregation ATPase FtsK/SpoIIIE, S-DNA-T family n=1 Tax=Pseudonocardia ammonioxydans TaxID=260086 RepID=A0A1I4WQR0_PSUAM|nr:hypothetical protein [Pseudonocardia ammonioxydans]SFN15359.1 DNA segregation ATPase FtsK/SpoIIIE, S-DNA-T family [Pseudonocardia ammonioxydans]
MTATGSRSSVPNLVEAGLRRTSAAMRHAGARYDRGQITLDHHWQMLAALHTRRVRWWTVLERHVLDDHTTPIVLYRAVLDARDNADRDARYWTQQAATAAERETGIAG